MKVRLLISVRDQNEKLLGQCFPEVIVRDFGELGRIIENSPRESPSGKSLEEIVRKENGFPIGGLPDLQIEVLQILPA